MWCSLKSNRGFSIIEMAIVLIIMGLLLSAGIPQFLAISRAQKNAETKKRQDVIKETVVRLKPLLPDGIGPVPCEALGLPPHYALDGFGHPMVFAYSGETLAHPLRVTVYQNHHPTVYDQIGLVVLSYGENGKPGSHGIYGPDELKNAAGDFVDRPHSKVQNDFFDDTITWIKLDHIRAGVEG